MDGIAEIEIKVAFLEDALGKIEQALSSQQQQILRMENALDQIHDRLANQADCIDVLMEG